MIIKLYSALTVGIDSHVIPIEIASELHNQFALSILGVSEYFSIQMKKRIEIACSSTGIELPKMKITVNLGQFKGDKNDIVIFDLPITLGILQCIGAVNWNFDSSIIVGELGLDGNIRPIKGIISIGLFAIQENKKSLYIPQANAKEMSMLEGINIYPITSLTQVLEQKELEKLKKKPFTINPDRSGKDFKDVKGQRVAKRALTIAAAGFHNTIFMGPPGSGKTMLAERLTSIMPPISYNEIIETSRIYSATGSSFKLITERPFRAPHHTVSLAGMIGGGVISPTPGEISLAHNGILFLDEFPEFKSAVLESLRQPLESHKVSLIRKSNTVIYPANFLMIAAFNPCPCGYLGDTRKACTCSRSMIAHYLAQISGPILDRIDLQLSLRSVEYEQIKDKSEEQNSESIYVDVKRALNMQEKRFGNVEKRNGTMSIQDIESFCVLDIESEALIKQAFTVLNLSMRGYHKILRISRTIADLVESEFIQVEHIKEALTYRTFDQSLSKLKS